MGSTKNATDSAQQNSHPVGADIWVRRWVDYSSKYGMGIFIT